MILPSIGVSFRISHRTEMFARKLLQEQLHEVDELKDPGTPKVTVTYDEGRGLRSALWEKPRFVPEKLGRRQRYGSIMLHAPSYYFKPFVTIFDCWSNWIPLFGNVAR